ncbi:MAG: four helix bundle protein [Candidatus Saccharimonadales bacterium]
MMSNEISKKIEDEMLDHEVAVVKFAERQSLPGPIFNQIAKSVTSIGANYAEAQEASSKKDFINKIYIAKKEASETIHWLKFIGRYRNNPDEIPAFIDKTQKFLMILQKIINSTRGQSSQDKG